MSRSIIREFLSGVKSEWNFTKKRFDRTVVLNERINKNYIRKYLPSRPVIIDAGAHAGSDSIEMCRLFAGSMIHAFEPVPDIFSQLKRNTKRFDRIKCYNLALSNQSGKQVMHISSGSSDGSSSFLRPKEHFVDHPDVYFESDLTVPTITLDDWAAAQKISCIDFLWLDMQGFELEVLKASKAIMPTISVIHMEVSTRMTYEGVPLYHEVKNWMRAHEFEVQVEAIPKGWDMGNVLFLRKNGKTVK